MGLSRRMAEADAAQRRVERHRQALAARIDDGREAVQALASPGRLLLGGLALGVVVDRLWPRWRARRDARQAARPAAPTAPPADDGLVATIGQGMRLVSSLMPLLMPLMARHSAEVAGEAAGEAASEATSDPRMQAAPHSADDRQEAGVH